VRAFVVIVLACVVVAACGGDDDRSDQTDVAEDGGPPTAGPREAGSLTDAGGIQGPPIPPECGDINVQDRLAEEEYQALLDDLDCIFENRDHMPPEALEIAREAKAMALEEIDETTDTGGEVEPELETEPEPEADE
jgi:hypothetical protein